MAKAPPAFQFYPADFLVGTSGMNHSSKATYLLLLCYEWTQAKLPYEPHKLARMIGISDAQFASDWAELECKFTIDDDGCLHNEKLESVRQRALALSNARKEAGRKGGSSKALAKLKQRGKQKGSKGSLKPEARNQKPKDRKEQTEDDLFEQFWALVRSKVAKSRSATHYANAVESLTSREEDPHAFLRDRMTAYAASDRGKGKYAWEPCSWLRDGHYDDDPEKWKGNQNGKPNYKTGGGQVYDPDAATKDPEHGVW